MSLFQELNHVSDNATIASVEECGRLSGITSTTGTTNTMDIVIDISWKIIIDNVSHIRYIKPTKCFRSQYFSFRMILGSEDMSQDAGEVSGPRDTMKREMMEQKT